MGAETTVRITRELALAAVVSRLPKVSNQELEAVLLELGGRDQLVDFVIWPVSDKDEFSENQINRLFQ